MISITFSGRLGNQLFQYAFIRSTAQRLGVKFYCPEWPGHQIFDLNDDSERTTVNPHLEKQYVEPARNFGFNENALALEDGMAVKGYFQSERCFDQERARKWFTFKGEIIQSVKEKYRAIDFSKSAGLSLRFGDLMEDPFAHFMPQLRYYEKAVSIVKHTENILVFSDEIEKAKNFLKGLRGNLIFMEGNSASEDLYLSSLCHDFICSSSTFSWWGAWLSRYPDKIVVIPKQAEQPSVSKRAGRRAHYICDGWISLHSPRYTAGKPPYILHQLLKRLCRL